MVSRGTRAVLVTGGCGFVGRNLVRRLLEEGVEDVWLIDDLSTGQHPDVWLGEVLPGAGTGGSNPTDYVAKGQRVRFLHGDVLALLGPEVGAGRQTGPVADWPRFDAAYHLASIVGGRVKIEAEPLRVGLDLAIDSVFFLWAWQRGRIERLLYASSSAAYPVDLQGAVGAVALEERQIDFAAARIGMPDMTYGWSKLTGEYLTWLLANNHGVPSCCVRPFSGYGEEQDLSYPVPAIAARAAQRHDPLVVWGSGLQGRDFVHIDDCIDAMRLAVDTISDGSGVNIGSGALTTFLEVAAIFARLEGYVPEIRGTEEGPVGVHARYADPAEAGRRLGWAPSVSLEAGFGRVLAAQARRLRSTADVD